MNVRIEQLDDTTGVEIVDPIERHRYELRMTAGVQPTRTDPEEFVFPVETAVAVETKTLTLPNPVPLYVHDETGSMIAEIEQFTSESIPDGYHYLDFPAPMKVYLRFDGAFTASSNTNETALEFERETRVEIGARSNHEHPAATITTTDDPEDVMRAISVLSSSLKATTPERSYPTLRGHPPMIELGEELSIPESLERPDTGIRIEVPPELESVYVVASLAYYLGAEVVPGSEPRIVTDQGFVYDLAPRFEEEVERVLKQTFFLDCVTRTEGLYRLDLHEREVIEPEIDGDVADLYGLPLSEQLEAYLEIPYAKIKPHIPDWKLTTHVAPTPDSVELLPFVVKDLAVIQTPQVSSTTPSIEEIAAVDDFFRDGFTRSAGATAAIDDFVQPSTSESVEHAWIGDGTPLGASKSTLKAYQNRLDRKPTVGDISITVICNDTDMIAERNVVDDIYGSRMDLPFEVTEHHGLTTDELRSVMSRQVDFLHYIGHIDDEGFQCSDGKLNTNTLDTVGLDTFFLNACSSYNQGMNLIDAGAIGGIVTLSDVVNEGAVRLGSIIAKLLNYGFALRSSLEIAKKFQTLGYQYLVIGDGGIAIAQAEQGSPRIHTIKNEGGKIILDIHTYPQSIQGMGAVGKPFLKENENYYLDCGHIGSFTVSKADLAEYLSMSTSPIEYNNKLTWPGEFELSDLS